METVTETVTPLTRHPATPCREYRGPRVGTRYGAPTFSGVQVLLHRWIVEQVEGPLLPGEVVMHLCDNPPCFRYDHLRRATQRDNILDAMAKGRHRYVPHYGEANGGGGKLTKEQAAEIRRRWKRGAPAHDPDSSAALSAEFGIYRTMVTRIGRGEAWAK